eukprot:jgi/Tetstr1/434796/TSEL_023846.t1
MFSNGSHIDPKMVEIDKAVAIEGVKTSATAQARIEAGRREAEDPRIYLAWIAERGTIGADPLQPYLSAINTVQRHTGRDDAPATGLAIIDKEGARQISQLKTGEELRSAFLPGDVVTDDLAALLTTTTDYGDVLRDGAAVC